MHDAYENPLCVRYASEEMKRIFSDDVKFRTWRRLWIALAEAERELGLPITEEQIAELKAAADKIDYDKAAAYESELRHDVMAHIRAYAGQCPTAGGIIHLGATSCYVGDNTDIIVMREALRIVRRKLINCIAAAADFAEKHKDVPTLAYTHFQPAQPTTAGKRATLWINDLISDLKRLDFELSDLKLLGCKGTTGTAASFLELFGGDHEKVKKLDRIIAGKMGFEATVPVSGQTYSRKVDYNVISVLSGIAQSAAKFSNDIRLLSHLKEFDEPFEPGQVGSSAMAYKRNPMRSERIASLARYVITIAQSPAITAATQWFERTLDDSANRRITIPEAFLATDAILSLYYNIISSGTLYPNMMKRHLDEEMPFMATENILMYCVSKGGNRQVLHEAIRRHSVAAAKKIKLEGGCNDLLDRILGDPVFGLTKPELDAILASGGFVGRAAEQTEEFLAEYVRPLLDANRGELGIKVDIRV
ncbi:MAG: adenylosuccinate lyase [Eubacteriales bacterium]|jgi:adenylosuccinate lyase